MSRTLYTVYTLLRTHFGAMDDIVGNWWPIFGTDAPFEMLLGSILVQQTRWESVEVSIMRLRDAGLLTPHMLAQTDIDTLVPLLRSVAFYRQKAAGIVAVSAYISTQYGGSVATMLNQPTGALREELLALPRIGPETADVILLYAGGHTVFVVDDYTRTLLDRVAPHIQHSLDEKFSWKRARYAKVRECIERELSHCLEGMHIATDRWRALYADYHALINEQCVRYCQTRRPRCDGPPARRVYSMQEGRDSYLDCESGCPLRPLCAFYGARV